jgi:hypothetical protein
MLLKNAQLNKAALKKTSKMGISRLKTGFIVFRPPIIIKINGAYSIKT